MSKHLEHFGIKGQKWGTRRYQNYDGSLTEDGRARYGVGKNKNWKQLKKDAAKDAKDYADAKAYYGEGAGNRRKLVKNRISERMKDPDYKAEFEKNLSSIDMEKTQQRMTNERRRNDAVNAASNTAKGVANFLMGAAVPMSVASIVLGATLKATGYDRKIAEWGQKTLTSAIKVTTDTGKKAIDAIRRATGKRQTVDDFLKNAKVGR